MKGVENVKVVRYHTRSTVATCKERGKRSNSHLTNNDLRTLPNPPAILKGDREALCTLVTKQIRLNSTSGDKWPIKQQSKVLAGGDEGSGSRSGCVAIMHVWMSAVPDFIVPSHPFLNVFLFLPKLCPCISELQWIVSKQQAKTEVLIGSGSTTRLLSRLQTNAKKALKIRS